MAIVTFKTVTCAMPLRYILIAQLIRLPQLRGSVVTGNTIEARAETI